MSAPTETPRSAIIVGASLGGLLAAIALARAGLTVTLLERTRHRGSRGAALRITGAGPEGVFDHARGLHVQSLRSLATGGRVLSADSWFSVHGRLLAAVRADERIRLEEGVRVLRAGQDQFGPRVETTAGLMTADVIIGADGYRSVVRHAVALGPCASKFAGYVLWVGLSPEAELPQRLWHPEDERGIFEWREDAVLFAGAFAASDGASAPGERDLGFVAYDPMRNDVLRDMGAIEGSQGMRSVRGRDLSDQVVADLVAGAERWPSPWRETIAHWFASRAFSGTPVTEYMPERLTRGRIALLGDAAHTASPLSGVGFETALGDAEALADALRTHHDVAAALTAYDQARLEEGRMAVITGRDLASGLTGE